jgi:hypothetical protein
MIVVSAVWILLLLGGGGFALDRVLTAAVTRNFDAQLEYVLTALLATAEIGPGRRGVPEPPARRPAFSSSLIRAPISRSAAPEGAAQGGETFLIFPRAPFGTGG